MQFLHGLELPMYTRMACMRNIVITVMVCSSMARLQGANEAKTNENLKKKSGYAFNKTEELVVQQLSAEVSGKAQKYLRVGPREFVPFKFENVTIENIKKACEKRFADKVGKNVCCDVLATFQTA